MLYADNHNKYYACGIYGKLAEIPCDDEDARKWYATELARDYSMLRLDFLNVATLIKNEKFINQIEKQFDGKIPRYE